MKKNLKKEKGQALVLVIVILGIILAIALGISHFVSQQIRMLREVGYSVRAFYTADSGIEKVLKDNAVPADWVNINGARYFVSCECCDKDTLPNCPNPEPSCPSGCPVPSTSLCRAPNFCLKSIGEYRDFRQAIEVDY